jgi:hypothetical protein
MTTDSIEKARRFFDEVVFGFIYHDVRRGGWER